MPSKKSKNNEVALSNVDKFYIENHGTLSVEELSRDLGKPVEIIQSYCTEYLKKNPPKKEYRARKLMDRPAKRGGVVTMTREASMVGDDSNHYVNLEMINQAAAQGDVELVKKLKAKYEQQEKENKQVIRNKYTEMIHYIESPDDDRLGVEGL